MKTWGVAVMCMLAGACHASIGDAPGTRDQTGGPDADLGGGPDGAMIGDGAVSGPDAPAAAARVVYLNFTGQALTKGAASDATAGVAAWLYQATTGTAPIYESGKSTRVADMTTIVTGVTSRLSGIATVTTTKPTGGEYVMVIYGGAAADVHSFYGVAVSQLDCGDVAKNDVAWIAESVAPSTAVDTTMGAIGFGLGLSSTTTKSNCMCSWGNSCAPTDPCTLADGIARDTAVSNDPNTGTPLDCGGGTEDELATFRAAFQ